MDHLPPIEPVSLVSYHKQQHYLGMVSGCNMDVFQQQKVRMHDHNVMATPSSHLAYLLQLNGSMV
jgi:hypothetical protein